MNQGPLRTLLIVDDESAITEVIESFFEEEGYQVFVADTAHQGISMLRKIKPTVLLLDMKLPDMSGLAVLEVAKSISPMTRVIVNTGYVDQAMMDEAERLGHDAFLHKPFDLPTLKAEVDRVVLL